VSTLFFVIDDFVSVIHTSQNYAPHNLDQPAKVSIINQPSDPEPASPGTCNASLLSKEQSVANSDAPHETNPPQLQFLVTSQDDFQRRLQHTRSSRLAREQSFLSQRAIAFSIPETFDFQKSTEVNYQDPIAPFVGKYAQHREQLDYDFHCRYSTPRQYLHDNIIDQFLQVTVHDSANHDLICESPEENWVVFTAGAMGAGKGHTMNWLSQQKFFPIEAFVKVDPDEIRKYLPETCQYNLRDDNTTGYLTQKEVGYIAEVGDVYVTSSLLLTRT
jgi:hypothetical protein